MEAQAFERAAQTLDWLTEMTAEQGVVAQGSAVSAR